MVGREGVRSKGMEGGWEWGGVLRSHTFHYFKQFLIAKNDGLVISSRIHNTFVHSGEAKLYSHVDLPVGLILLYTVATIK